MAAGGFILERLRRYLQGPWRPDEAASKIAMAAVRAVEEAADAIVALAERLAEEPRSDEGPRAEEGEAEQGEEGVC